MTQATNTTQLAHDDDLLDPLFAQQLDRLDVLSRKILVGKIQGERRSKRKGQSVEFADYRNYVTGDDLRFVDWNLYARLDRLFLRLFIEEEDLAVSIVLDVSKSMDWGEPNKLRYGKKLTAALGYIGLVNYNRVHFYTFAQTLADSFTNLRGRRPLPQMLEFLRAVAPQGSGNLARACQRLALTLNSKGVIVLVSDFLDKGELSDALRYLGGNRHDVYAIQLLAPQELDPVRGNIVGDLRLRDIEDQNIAEVSVTPALVKRYKANLEAYCKYIREQCARRGVTYLMSDTSMPLDTLVLHYLRIRGLLG